jgi:hypothetical protein
MCNRKTHLSHRIVTAFIGGAVLALAFGLPCGPAGIVPQAARADEPQPGVLSPLVRRALSMLPEDTETVVAAQSFAIPEDFQSDEPRDRESLSTLMPLTALSPLDDPELAKLVGPLLGKKISLALRGGRNHEWVSATLPAFRTEGCTIVIFESDLGDAGADWEKIARQRAAETRKIASRDVFVYPPLRAMRQKRASHWPGKLGVYLLLLDPKTLLCATSDKFLEEVLRREEKPQPGRALPDSIPEWKHVDLGAKWWGMRHLPQSRDREPPLDREPVIAGVTWTMEEKRFRAVFIPVAGAKQSAVRFVERLWDKKLFPIQPSIEGRDDATVVVSAIPDDLGEEGRFGFPLTMYWLEALQ